MRNRKQEMHVDGRTLIISNLDKVFFPESGFTKGEVIAFYSDVAEVILPHLRDRPLTLKRYPDGIEGEHFYEKNAPVHTPSWVERVAVPRSEGGPDIQYVVCNDRATLLWATNLADIEKHVLLARAPALHRPTSIVFDLDPGEPATILDCGQIALQLKELFDAWQLASFVKVSGSKGLHLSVPLNSEVTYEMTQPFAKAVAELATQRWPDRVVADMAKKLRRGKVLIDWSQNSDFKTTVCVYAMRAKRAAPFISMPITWDELRSALKRRDPARLDFTPQAAIRRIKRVGDLFAPVLEVQQTLPPLFTDALAAGPPPKLARWPRKKTGGASIKDKSLREYAARRDHAQTPEPPARVSGKKAKGNAPRSSHRFVIQKHAASHLHYDWRLEMQGVLRSWAVPKGPPVKLREARLAMHVEDHPVEYADFEGTIPPGNYGAGTVMVWDRGEYEDLTGNPAAAYHAGKMHIVMQGEKLQGEWILVKDRREPESNKWLLIKAGKAMKPFSKTLDDRSVITGRTMEQIARANDAQWQSNRPAARTKTSRPRFTSKGRVEPAFVVPMQCKPVSSLPDDSPWSYEIKFDGYRAIAVKHDQKVRLYSRNEKILDASFPAIIAAFASVPGDLVVDGEIVALDSQGLPSFQLLQNYQSSKAPIYFYAFDLLNDNRESLLNEGLARRRERLEAVLAEAPEQIRLSPILHADSGQVLAAVRKLGLEGVVGKRLDSMYEPGKRSGAWIKHRTNNEQEFVIGGYIPGSRGFDALLVGVYEGEELVFVAKVKSGFVPRLRDELFPTLKRIGISKCPFTNLPEKKSSRWGESLTAEKMKECRWVKPQLVCQVGFVEWTEANHLRHCTFLGMRDDKGAREVVRET
jgi:bifunctional non-homologous end joining protein LigD